MSILTKNSMSYQTKTFLGNLTPGELTPCKIFHICRCGFNWYFNAKIFLR